MSLNSFWYTEPSGGTKFRSYDSGGIHAQVVILGGTDTLSLPTDSTYGLSIDIKRVVAGAAFSIADHTTTTSYASVLNTAPAFDAYGLTVRIPAGQVLDTHNDEEKGLLRQIRDLLIQLNNGLSGWIGNSFRPAQEN